MISRLILMKAHVILAAFILPVVIMFSLTGSLYTWGIKGGYETISQELPLKEPLPEDLGYLVEVVDKVLKKHDLSLPTGTPKIKKTGKSFQLEWTGSNRDIILKPTANPLIANIKIKNTTQYRQFVQLHKAKGGIAFKVYATILAISLLLLLISGFIMAWQTPTLRRITTISTIFGLIFFFAMFISN